MSTPGDLPPELQFPRPQLPTHGSWLLPPDPMVPDPASMTDHQRTADPVERVRCEVRSEALRLAVYLRDEAREEGVLHKLELNEVVDDARRFYEYIWEGK